MRQSRGIRDVTEWYISPKTRADYMNEVFSWQRETATTNLERIHARIGDSVDAVVICGTDFGRPEQVREEVLRPFETFGPNGSYVFNAIQNIQARTPVENIVAAVEAVHEFNGDP